MTHNIKKAVQMLVNKELFKDYNCFNCTHYKNCKLAIKNSNYPCIQFSQAPEKKETKPITITKYISILFDGNQHTIKLPKIFSRLYNLKKRDTLKLYVKIPLNKSEDPIQTFEVLKSQKPFITSKKRKKLKYKKVKL